ncbi:MAG: tRNA pseudouridine(38-40) synthase TruA [Spirochaetes bacterium GWB1_60_80]|nr:MAG: tRNA pseudouridine(38-40) synthase TruA [Spirochaetes bacterium GWB1_60_80]OHD43683.1 MAG: tRNA pseudouridine(38-40) synthase TruA [Spirochaetes bacterium GWE1_60_18]OHD58880.1 MAG: tRNA pseudouridine(38-40) synthase TruA [Spirochaetes bacterium GWF1_60_12]HAP44479.1 tRNA pseudouridine(38-40) synthase TruA [Spirochaetaceae bacterium]HAW86278.1 tRNA pseudouridine(38-40) synthase TruA [Spirochaetaceae bacterium]
MSDQRNILLTLSYDGSAFSGWQRLGDAQRTVQASLEASLSSLLGETVNVIGAGRTDAGVHAEGQAANFRLASAIELPELLAKLAGILPPDLKVLAAREALPTFHARFRAVAKTYAYRLHDGPTADPHPGKRAYHVTHRLDETRLQQAAALFTGIRNFRAFTTVKADSRNFLRELTEVRLERKANLLDIFFTADGFLNRQARAMAALLAEIGQDRQPVKAVSRALESGERAGLPGPLAAYGLRLVSVAYRETDFLGPVVLAAPAVLTVTPSSQV